MDGRHDTEEIQRSFCEHQPALVAYVSRIVGRHDVAEDIAQDAYEIALRSGASESLERPMLYTIAHRRSIDWLRHQGTHARLSGKISFTAAPHALGCMVERLIKSELIEELERVIAELEPSLSRPLKLRLQDKSREDIARELEISVRALEQRNTRAFARIRERLLAIFGNSPS